MRTACFTPFPVRILIFATALFITMTLPSTAASADIPHPGSPQKVLSFKKKIKKTVGYQYLLFLPHEYDANSSRSWPLIISLHGSGERGTDIEKVRRSGLTHYADDMATTFPFIVASPQCTEAGYGWWQNDALLALLDDLTSRCRVDSSRVYLTGYSMGGYGVWNLASEYPERFAAIAPICGAGYDDVAPNLRTVPAWVFHGAQDPVVPVKEAEDMIRAIKACGGEIKSTIYPDGHHNVWDRTYRNPELYEWLLQHHRAAANDSATTSPAP